VYAFPARSLPDSKNRDSFTYLVDFGVIRGISAGMILARIVGRQLEARNWQAESASFSLVSTGEHYR
jgi:hypothetical protein